MDRAPQPQLTPNKNLGSAIPVFWSQRPVWAGGQAEEEVQRGEGICLPVDIFRHHHLCDQDANWRLPASFLGSPCPVKWWIHLSWVVLSLQVTTHPEVLWVLTRWGRGVLSASWHKGNTSPKRANAGPARPGTLSPMLLSCSRLPLTSDALSYGQQQFYQMAYR